MYPLIYPEASVYTQGSKVPPVPGGIHGLTQGNRCIDLKVAYRQDRCPFTSTSNNLFLIMLYIKYITLTNRIDKRM